MSKDNIKPSELVNVAAGGAGLGLGVSGAAAGIVAAAPVTATTTSVFAGATFVSGGAPLVSPLVAAMASNPVGWAIGGAIGLCALWAMAKESED
jgi:hypothetical protein